MSGDKKLLTEEELKEKKALDSLVRSLAADYKRRQRILREGSPAARVKMELVYLNSKIYDAAAEICGENLALAFIGEIGEGIGYASSSICCLGEWAYKTYKADIVRNIARKLYLV